ncbi:MAG: hypothetical protein V4508_12950 [Pseudomonadota bacterium]
MRFIASVGTSGVFGLYSDQPVDRLCLDGQRLVLVLVNGDTSNTANWSGTPEYRTEVESFTRVTTVMIGSKRTFKVETQDRQILYYGDPPTASSTPLTLTPISSPARRRKCWRTVGA